MAVDNENEIKPTGQQGCQGKETWCCSGLNSKCSKEVIVMPDGSIKYTGKCC
ncbi:hypothetical protein Q8G35_15895 [Peribacillus simplex]|uniref:Uncharacterized protein n=2 Tax=Peribacillus TaxID=2675229 RepID=A0AA90T3W5_9BACI|nr:MULTISPECIES: hypothetical protein [Peribacillus]MDP1419833.1 hypothetical protein [Peribacillus simplex]MDP1453073.1 hypothetical protein [Peribacillus frigoritolerans]